MTRFDAELLFRLKDGTLEDENAETWGDLFVDGVANFLKGFVLRHAQMDRERKLELQAFLTDNEDFLVVGVLGPQGSGKSTVINAMYARTEGEAKSVNTVYTRFLLWR